MRMIQEMTLHARETAMIRAAEATPDPNCGRDEVLFDREAVFPDGMRVAIRLVAALHRDDYPWAEAVAFDQVGNERGCSEVHDTIFGEWELHIDDNEYVVRVHPTLKGQVRA